ncbi:MAG: aminotransferase class I/II-fold pyridoxal phosphate-dependent enzyme, partial [Kiritimatiellae bacterium]|nr:aminotransferase class I/II-fold pyridoxal phosphate-dependent enzyme [Kiritimatiellia bacterium]
RCFVRRGGTIGAFAPTYSLYPVLAEIRDVAYAEAPLAPGFAWQTPQFPDGAAPDLFFLTNPNAPTGVAYPVRAVRDFAASFDGTVLVDEAYADFAGANCMALAAAPDNENVIVSRTLSKSFSLAGLRLGYCVGPERLIEAMFKAKDSYNLDGVAQALALAALDDIDWMRTNAAKIREERARLTAALKARGWRCTHSRTNFVFARPPEGNAAEIAWHLKSHGVLVRHFSLPLVDEWLRVTVGTPAEDDAFLEALPQ